MGIFLAVVDSGSFARASDNLQVSRPTVTNGVKVLEASLGVRLLQRTTRRISLTAEGLDYYDRASQILSDVQDARASMAARVGKVGMHGRLRIDLPAALARPLLIAELKRFRDMHPDIEFVVGVSDHPVDLVAEGVDCVVRIGELRSSSMVARNVGALVMVNCASPAYLNDHGRPTGIDDLQAHRAVGFFSGRSQRMMDWHFVLDGEAAVVKVKPGILVNDSEGFIEAGLAGFGLLQAIGIGVGRHIERGELVPVLSDLQVPPRAVSVLYPTKRFVAPQVRAFVDWIAELFAAGKNKWLMAP